MTFTAADIQMVEDHIAQGEQHVIRQEQLISRMRSRGVSTNEAENLLGVFRATLAQHREHRTMMIESVFPRGP